MYGDLWAISTTPSVAKLFNVEWYEQRRFRKDLEGSGRGLIEGICQHLPGRAQ
jgi:hypothetical protein